MRQKEAGMAHLSKNHRFCLLLTLMTGFPAGIRPIRIILELAKVLKSGKKQISQVNSPSDLSSIWSRYTDVLVEPRTYGKIVS